MKNKSWLIDFLKGTSLGTGILPGVSVGTVGIIVDIYEKLLNAINGLRKEFSKAFKVLFPIALGCVISALILLVAQDTLYSFIPFEMTCLFAGFVLIGIPVVYKDIRESKLSKIDITRIVIGFLIASGIGILSVISKLYWNIDMSEAFLSPNKNWWIFPITGLVGFVAAVGCLLPGISGSMILFIFGLYQPVVGLFKGDNSMLHNHERIGSGVILTIILFIGVVIGLFATSKAMTSLIEKHKKSTYTWVIGFILGSFVSMFVNQDIIDVYPSLNLLHFCLGLVILFISFFSFYFLLKNKVLTPQKQTKERK